MKVFFTGQDVELVDQSELLWKLELKTRLCFVLFSLLGVSTCGFYGFAGWGQGNNIFETGQFLHFWLSCLLF